MMILKKHWPVIAGIAVVVVMVVVTACIHWLPEDETARQGEDAAEAPKIAKKTTQRPGEALSPSPEEDKVAAIDTQIDTYSFPGM